MLNRLEMLRIFCVAAESKNFKEAAIRLHMSPQAITRAIKELERLSGELLFHRNTRQSQITAFGASLAERARLGVEGIDKVFDEFATPQRQQIAGRLSITAPVALADDYLMPFIAAIRRDYPQLYFDVLLSDASTDVVDEKIDLGIRLGQVRQASMIARAVVKAGFYFVASPDLIERYGEPQSIDELAQLPVTAVLDPNTGRPWPWFIANGQFWTPTQPAIQLNDTRAECYAMVQGVGYGQLIDFLARPYLQRGQLRRILHHAEPAPWNLYVYRPQRGPVSARVRIVFDALCDFFAQHPDFNPLATLA